jgi:hemerythrin-like metal-binding protein
MDSIQWLPKYNIGDKKIDSDHQTLVKMLIELQVSKERCLDRDETEKLFDKLEAYSDNHFSYEEELLEKINFPFLQSHIKDHQFFRNMITKWRNDEKIDCKSEKISTFLTEWLFEHILHYDMKVKEYLPESIKS